MDQTHIINKLRALSTTMLDVAADLDYLAGFNAHWRDNAIQLGGAAHVANSWADKLEAQITTVQVEKSQVF